MYFEAVVISGTRCAGKSTLGNALLKFNSKFGLVKAATTRSKRSDEDTINYYHLSDSAFTNENMIISTVYGQYKYGIEQKEIERVIESGKIPILIISADALSNFTAKNKNNYLLSFFIDAKDELLDERLNVRGTHDKKQMLKEYAQRKIDRDHAFACTYKINNSSDSFDESLCELVEKLWNFRKSGGMLSKSIITLLTRFDVLLKGASQNSVSSSSYDLSLGDEYYYKGKIRNLSDRKPFILIEPYDYAIVTSREYARLPNDIAGKFDLKVSLFCQGVILSNGPQVDPGFEGNLFCLLFNTSNSPVTIKRGDHYATLEFNKLIEPTEGYKGQYQAKSGIINYLPSNTLQGGVNELKKEVEKLKNESIKLQTTILGIISLLLALIAIYRAMA